MSIFSFKNLQRLYIQCGGIGKKIDMQENSFELHDHALKLLSTTESLTTNLQHVLEFMQLHEQKLNNLPRQAGKKTPEQLIVNLNSAISSASKIKDVYASHKDAIGGISDLKNAFSTSVADIRTNIETEAFSKASDLRHKIYLTLLRAVQIPIFIFVTYISIFGVVKLLGEKDLVIPRGLISIVPSSLERNAQNLAVTPNINDNINSTPSAIPKSAVTKKSITHSLTPSISNTQTQ